MCEFQAETGRLVLNTTDAVCNESDWKNLADHLQQLNLMHGELAEQKFSVLNGSLQKAAKISSPPGSMWNIPQAVGDVGHLERMVKEKKNDNFSPHYISHH